MSDDPARANQHRAAILGEPTCPACQGSARRTSAKVVFPLTGDPELDAISGVLAVLREVRLPPTQVRRIIAFVSERNREWQTTDREWETKMAKLMRWPPPTDPAPPAPPPAPTAYPVRYCTNSDSSGSAGPNTIPSSAQAGPATVAVPPPSTFGP